jgi:hypothetical protein
MRSFLHALDYPEKDNEVVGTPDARIVGLPTVVYRAGHDPAIDGDDT